LVLALLTIAMGMAFSVTGKIFLRYDTAGPVASRWGGDTFDDLWLGKVNSGFEVNFDGFTFQYQLRDGMSDGGSFVLDSIVTVIGGGLQSSTPGYFRISGVKAGPVDLAVGLQWNTLMESGKTTVTNPGATTNAYDLGFNQVYVDATFGVKIADNMELKVKDWDRIYFTTEFGNYKEGDTNGGTTTTNEIGNLSSFATRIPVWFILSGTGFNYEARASLKMTGDNWSYGTDDSYSYSTMMYEILVRGSFDLNETFGIWTALAFQGGSMLENGKVAGTAVTYQDASYMKLPIFVGLLYKMAPGITWDIGAGYNITLANVYNDNTVPTTNTSVLNSGLFGDKADLSDNWNNPFLHVGGTGKAGDWELGINFNVVFLPVDTTDITSDKAGAYSADQILSIFNFQNRVNYDENVYIKWAKDQIEIQGVLGAAGDLAGLFGVMNFTVKF
jgi:hypothetical protein